jgi:hypothetical protein
MKISNLKNTSAGFSAGSYLLHENSGMSVFGPSWDHPTIFCPIAANEDGKILPPFTADYESLTPWMHEAPRYVKAAGSTRKISFDASLPEDEAQVLTELPYARLRRVVSQLAKTAGFSEYEQLLKGDSKNGPALPKMHRIGLMQGILYYHNNKDYSANPKAGVVFAISASATSSMGAMFENAENQKILQEHLFASHLMFYYSQIVHRPQVPMGWNIIINQTAGIAQNILDSMFKQHVAHVVAPPQSLNVPSEEYMLGAFRPWNEVIRVLNISSQMEILCGSFEPSVIYNAYKDSEFWEYLPQWLRNRQSAPPVHSIPLNTNTQKLTSGAPSTAPFDMSGDSEQSEGTASFIGSMLNKNKPLQSAPITGAPVVLTPTQSTINPVTPVTPVQVVTPITPANPAINAEQAASSTARLEALLAARRAGGAKPN